jgi:protein TonB
VEQATTAVTEAAVESPRFDLAYLRNPAPAYPSLSRRLHEQGRVMLRVRVAASGDPREVRVESSSGSERLDRAALEAVRHWRFAPARRGGEPIEGEALVPVTFSLDA